MKIFILLFYLYVNTFLKIQIKNQKNLIMFKKKEKYIKIYQNYEWKSKKIRFWQKKV